MNLKQLIQVTTLIVGVVFFLLFIAIYPGNQLNTFFPKEINSPDLGRTLQIKAYMPPLIESVRGEPWNGKNGIKESVNKIMDREYKHPFVFRGPRETKEESEVFQHPKSQNPVAPETSEWPPLDRNNIYNQNKKSYNPQTVGVSFDGPQLSESGFIPPDNNGAAGPTQLLIIANGRIKVFDKSGVLGVLNTTTDNFFTSVRNGSGTSDPHIRYDRLTQRWFITMINVSTPNKVLIAVSSGPTITGSSSFTFYSFQHDQVGTTPNSDTGGFADYDTFGLDRFALYIGVNVFNAAGNAILGTTGFVVNKANIISGALSVSAFRQLTNGSSTGPWTPQGVDNDDPNANEGYFIGVDFLVFSQLDIRRISNPGGTPTISGNITLTVPTTYFPNPQNASGSIHPLDAIDDRLFAAHIHKNKITGSQSLWTAHNILVNSSGVGSSLGDRNGSRWYEITNLTTTPVLNQSGTLYDTIASNPKGFWMPSVAMSGQGHMGLGCSMAGSNYFAQITSSGRLYSDILGTTQQFTLDQNSSTAYNVQNTLKQRWGDFSQVNLDPNDDMTMWTIQEYCNVTNSWCERVIQLKAPPPATPTSATSVSTGLPSVNSTITGTVVSGSGFFDPGSDLGGPGYSNHINASVSGGVIVNSITFNSPTQVTLNLNTIGTPTGVKDVTITNPDGQTMTGIGILNITPALPVEMSSFTSLTQDRNVNLYWTTAFEIMNAGFDIERKNSTSANWNKIGYVKGNGTTTNPTNYSFSDYKLNTGNYNYRLKQFDYNGNFEYFNLNTLVSVGSPLSFNLSQNYPNPSNPVSKIDFQLPLSGEVKMTIFDATGKSVKTLVNQTMDAGYYTVTFDGNNLASGIYYYNILIKMKSQSYSKTMKLVLIK
jgi:hypothetical protein